jgi:hypothetical protein
LVKINSGTAIKYRRYSSLFSARFEQNSGVHRYLATLFVGPANINICLFPSPQQSKIYIRTLDKHAMGTVFSAHKEIQLIMYYCRLLCKTVNESMQNPTRTTRHLPDY